MKFFLTFLTFQSAFLFGQSNIISFNTRYHLDFWKPYTTAVDDYQDSTNSLESYTLQLDLGTEFQINQKWWMSSGCTYKSINYRVIDQIHKWNYVHTFIGQGMVNQDTLTRIYKDPADLVAVSKSWGVRCGINYQLSRNEKVQTSIGFSSELYLVEFYRSSYQSEDHSPNDYLESIPISIIDNEGRFYFSSMNLNIDYRIRWQFASQFNAGLKLSVGTNLYSNWSHFSRNAWIGCGLEFGFSRKPKVE